MNEPTPFHDLPAGGEPSDEHEQPVGTLTLDPEAGGPERSLDDPADPEVPDEAEAASEEDDAPLQNLASWIVVAVCALAVFASLHPQLLFQDTTTTGGDMGAHVWGPRFLADHLLPQGRLTGWTQDWYAGFPAYVFYMVVPSLAIVWLHAGPPVWLTPLLLVALGGATWQLRRVLTARWARTLMWIGVVVLGVLAVPLPYNVAFKLVTVSGLVTLPIAAFVLARAARTPFPVPALAAMATLPFIYNRGFTILGGNGASTLAGEFAFSISLTLALLYLAVVFRGVRTGRDRALGAVLLALTVLCHLIPAIFAGVATVVICLTRREDREPWWDRGRAGRIVATLAVAVTLLTIVPTLEVFGFEVASPLPQWWFPILATVVAIALFTGFEPRIVQWWLTPVGRVVGAVVLAGGAAALFMRSTWMALVVVAIALVVAFFSGWDDRAVRWCLSIAPVGALLTMFWTLPFVSSSTYMNDMGWEKYTDYRDHLLAVSSLDAGGMPYRNAVFALAGIGVLLSLIHRLRFGWFLALSITAFAWIFRYFPQYRLWNARLLPFLYLCIYLLAAVGLGLAIRSIALTVAELSRRRELGARVNLAGLVVAFGALAVTMLAAFAILPGGERISDPGGSNRTLYHWAGISFPTTLVSDWARWNYSGLEGKDSYPEFSGIVDMMDRVSEEHGCGRAMWEYEKDLQRFGTPMALMLLPYFTDGCVGSMEGLYFEASSTTPFHFLNQSALSVEPSRAQRDLAYTGFDIDLGVSQLQMLGVRYYMATSETAIDAARAHEDLTEVGFESFPNVSAATEDASNDWAVFLVADSDPVVPLERTPTVLEGVDDHIDGWVYEAERPEGVEGEPAPAKLPGPAARWFQDPSRWDTLLATDGPGDWPRGTFDTANGLSTELPEAEVSNVVIDQSSVSFDVDRTGVPVLVRVSYFPNWGVEGADGPWRVSPNAMVVVPTDTHVELSYGYRAPDVAGWALTFLGVGLLAFLGMRDVRDRRADDARSGPPR